MKVEILPAGVAPPSRKTPAPFTPRRGMTVQTMPQARPVLPVLANLKPNYIPPAVRAAMVKGQPPGFAYGIPTPGQLPVGVGSGMVRKFNPAALGRGGGLDGFGAFGTASLKSPGTDCPAQGSWETYCACMYDGETLAKCLTKPGGGAQIYCPPWASAPWTECGKSARFGAGGEGIVGAGKSVIGVATTITGGGVPTATPTPAEIAMAERCPKIPGTNTLRPNFPGCPESNTGGGGGGGGGSGDESSVGTIAIVAAGLAAAGGIGYLFLRGRRSTPIGSFSRRKARRGRK